MGNEAVPTLQEDHLKKVIGLGGAISLSIGQIIGAGIMALTGVGIGMTGGSIVLAFLMAAVFMVIACLPSAYMGASLPTTGGGYRYTSRLMSPSFGFIYLLLFWLGQISLAMYALSFGEYVESIAPGAPVRLIAFLFMTVFYLTNLFGMKSAANIQKIMMLVLLAALLFFVIMGVGDVNLDTFSGPTMFTGGIRGFITASALMTFATAGAVVVAEMGGEMKNPGRDIPISIIASTIIVGILYALVSVVAVGILPLDQTAFQPLSNVAREIFSTPMFYFFIIGGALCALATTMNATFSWLPKGILIACQDGWLPKSFGKVNEKFGTPHFILTFLYIIGVIPIFSGLSLKFIAQLGTGTILIASTLPVLSSLFLAKKYPEAHRKSKFKFSQPNLIVIVILAIAIQAVQGYFLLSDVPATALMAAGGYVIIAIIYTLWRRGRTEISRSF